MPSPDTSVMFLLLKTESHRYAVDCCRNCLPYRSTFKSGTASGTRGSPWRELSGQKPRDERREVRGESIDLPAGERSREGAMPCLATVQVLYIT